MGQLIYPQSCPFQSPEEDILDGHFLQHLPHCFLYNSISSAGRSSNYKRNIQSYPQAALYFIITGMAYKFKEPTLLSLLYWVSPKITLYSTCIDLQAASHRIMQQVLNSFLWTYSETACWLCRMLQLKRGQQRGTSPSS